MRAILARTKRSDTADGWARHVANRGGTHSADTLAALRQLDADLQLFDLKRKLVYFNPRAGSDITAAKVPMIARNGPGFDVVASGSFAAWNETNGLVNSSSGVMDTGVSATTTGVNPAGAFALGVYMLSDAANATAILNTADLFPQLQPRNSGLTIFDFAGNRTQTAPALTADGTLTKGLIGGSRFGAGSANAAVFRNGVLRGVTNTALASAVYSAKSIRISGAAGTSGGDFAGLDLTPDDWANLTWIMHAFNAALGRQVTAEGLS